MSQRKARSLTFRPVWIVLAWMLVAGSTACDGGLVSESVSYEIVVANATNLPVHLSVVDLDQPDLIVGTADPAEVPGRTTVTVAFTAPSASDWAVARDGSAFLQRSRIEEAIRLNRESTCPVPEPIRIEITGASSETVSFVDEQMICPR